MKGNSSNSIIFKDIVIKDNCSACCTLAYVIDYVSWVAVIECGVIGKVEVSRSSGQKFSFLKTNNGKVGDEVFDSIAFNKPKGVIVRVSGDSSNVV